MGQRNLHAPHRGEPLLTHNAMTNTPRLDRRDLDALRVEAEKMAAHRSKRPAAPPRDFNTLAAAYWAKRSAAEQKD
jgi:hypothetical protein